ncbi:MAG: hypothetical protein ABSG43_19830 [Solirubrobacteraceae bacterium]
MATLLKILGRALRAIVLGCGEHAYMGLLGPVPWPVESYRPASTRRPR